MDQRRSSAGAGNDSISTGAGDDSVDAGAGDDTIFGGVRNDSIGGGKGNSTIFGGDGNDLIAAGSDDNLILTDATLTRAGQGIMRFSAIERALRRRGSRQLLDASAATLPTQLVGGAGDDTLFGGAGDDTLEGGRGTTCSSEVSATTPMSSDQGSGRRYHPGGRECRRGCARLLELRRARPVDLNQVGPQVISPGLLTLSFSGPTAIEDVYGSAFNDIITGNVRDNRIYGDGGADSIDGGPGNDYIHGSRTQVVYLDFTWTAGQPSCSAPARLHPAERDAIQEQLGADYADFSFTFTQVQPASGPYVTLLFDIPLGDYSGGAADEIDWRNLNPTARPRSTSTSSWAVQPSRRRRAPTSSRSRRPSPPMSWAISAVWSTGMRSGRSAPESSAGSQRSQSPVHAQSIPAHSRPPRLPTI